LRTVVVDGANVMGSRPDGWWRDRAGAAARLHDDLATLAGEQKTMEFVLVLEGAARAAKLSPADNVRVVSASGSGDDTIAELAGAGTLVVTADRELRRRCEQRGAEVIGPGWLLRQFKH
jgi:8-oxo-dGTP diphosphatase